MKILSVVGTRPQFIKLYSVCKHIKHKHIIVRTGQHYDANMGDIFFDELGLPKPDYNLKIGINHIADILTGLKPILENEKPDAILVYGDTDSTLGAALASLKMQIPTMHIEAGLRSFDRTMPEEMNRKITDNIAWALIAPTRTAEENLKKESLENIYTLGDITHDTFIDFKDKISSSLILHNLKLKQNEYYLATIHRPINTESANLKKIFKAFNKLDLPVVIPVHPRINKMIYETKLTNVFAIEPIGYIDMLALEAGARKIITDSNGVQKEAYFWEKPCLLLRNNTEWPELSDNNILCNSILDNLDKKHECKYKFQENVGGKICALL